MTKANLSANYRKQLLKTFRILFEDVNARGFIGWTTVEECMDRDDALNYFQKHFPDKEIIQISEIRD
jgi:hypothetical protein